MLVTNKDRDLIKLVIGRAVERRRHVIVNSLAKRIYDLLLTEDLVCSQKQEWIEIASLSQLRKAVGGRFENLKERWINAGFPLREHRGDRKAEASFVESGWLELSTWMFAQGFESRLSSETSKAFFEVRRI